MANDKTLNLKPIKIRKGLKLPIKGEVSSTEIKDKTQVKQIAILGNDYVGMKPTMLVKEGDRVKKGQALFEDKKQAGIKFTAPAAGEIASVNRGDKRAFQSIVINISGNDEVTFKQHSLADLQKASADDIKQQLLDSGQWVALRARPFSKTADASAKPHSIFITAIDTNPLAPDPQLAINQNSEYFKAGVIALSRLTDGRTFVCKHRDATLPESDGDNIEVASFFGKHPAGNVGTHIHFLDPVSETKQVWHAGYQDVIAIGALFMTGKIFTERLISIAGPAVKEPALVKTQVGANIDELTSGNLQEGENRLISGSVFSGNKAKGPTGFIGRYHNQVSALAEGRERELLGWQTPGFNNFSIINLYVSKLIPGKKFGFTTTTNGSPRSMVPIGMYEKVMPLDILPTQLLRALYVRDTESAAALGALELDEEDLALCTFADPGKTDYGPILRDNLTRIEKGE